MHHCLHHITFIASHIEQPQLHRRAPDRAQQLGAVQHVQPLCAGVECVVVVKVPHMVPLAFGAHFSAGKHWCGSGPLGHSHGHRRSGAARRVQAGRTAMKTEEKARTCTVRVLCGSMRLGRAPRGLACTLLPLSSAQCCPRSQHARDSTCCCSRMASFTSRCAHAQRRLAQAAHARPALGCAVICGSATRWSHRKPAARWAGGQVRRNAMPLWPRSAVAHAPLACTAATVASCESAPTA